ncbi:hypothetical protein AGLY_012349 [Aphis glycines]|uniref:Transposable element P transposase-like GTP-binding insertion domain-containing protein n=1 Tax=Aphis glycines TaxID=307491 RepID=A0A6G0TC09_APHGL|nr:hypothetical protein AGLY_012349 [Aphis glycines]
MKVLLTAQTFSSSVSDALSYCSLTLNLDVFKNCEATITLCQKINNIFDFLNTRNFLNENNIYQLLYEEIPSDDDSETSCDDSDNDADYCLPSREVVISESSSDSEYEDSEILNLDNHNIYLLPSPLKKTRLSLKRKNNNKDGEIPKKLPVSRRQLFSNFNFEEGDMSGIQPLATPSSSQSSQPQINI